MVWLCWLSPPTASRHPLHHRCSRWLLARASLETVSPIQKGAVGWVQLPCEADIEGLVYALTDPLAPKATHRGPALQGSSANHDVCNIFTQRSRCSTLSTVCDTQVFWLSWGVKYNHLMIVCSLLISQRAIHPIQRQAHRWHLNRTRISPALAVTFMIPVGRSGSPTELCGSVRPLGCTERSCVP